MKWTSKNVKTLGVYFGNDHPGEATFQEIKPKIIKSMNYWKQFKLSKMAKARVIEIFHASRLWYAAKFYPIPVDTKKELQQAFANYINFPAKAPTVTQQELFKLRKHGGLKLIHIDTKSTASKIKWLIEMTTNPKLTHHLNIMTRLMKHQPAGHERINLFFTTTFSRRRRC